MNKDNPSYYSIIPADVRYDERLSANEKLLYGEITALSQLNGYCYATNKYFAKLYKKSDRSIQNWISNLIKFGYIDSQMIYKKDTKEIIGRHITVLVAKNPSENNHENFVTPREENFVTSREENFCPPREENFTYNNIKNNNTSNNNNPIVPLKKSPKKTENRKAQKHPYEEIVNYLNQKTGSSFRHTTKKVRKLIDDRFKDGHTLGDFKRAIDNQVALWWNNVDMRVYLRPDTLFSNKMDGYANATVTKAQMAVAQGKISPEIAKGVEEGTFDIKLMF